MYDNLNERQREAVEYNKGPLLVLAGAGSGKTRVLTAKITEIIKQDYAEPWEILAMTFTNKAADEMRQRIERMLPGSGRRVRMGTFHSICAWILRREAHNLEYPSNFTIYDADDQKTLIRRLLKTVSTETKITPGIARSYISNYKNDNISPEEVEEAAAGRREKDIAAVYREYQKRLKESGAFDFDDLLTSALALFRQYNDIRDRYASSFRYILVDEYQDTNKVQHQLLIQLSAKGALVSVVGDDDQSIYSWRGACVENILEFSRDFPGTKVVRLEENYRSTGNILKGASALVDHNRRRHGKTLWTRKDEGCPIRVKCLYNEREEAEWVLQEILELLEEGRCREDSIAVLYRTNAQSRQFETACRKRGIDYEIVGSQRFYERMEIKDIIAYLRFLLNPEDRLSLQRMINKPRRGLGKKGRKAFFDYVDELGQDPVDCMLNCLDIRGITSRARNELKKLGQWYGAARKKISRGVSAFEIVNGLIESTGITAMYDSGDVTDQSRLENIAEFERSVAEYDREVPDGGLEDFMTRISLATTSDDYQGRNSGKVALMTLHCAKGLEFDTVFIAGLEEGMLPFVRPGEYGPYDMEEERRLLYVGMTRARERLILTHTVNRRRHGVRQSGPSRFLREVADGQCRIPSVEDTRSRKVPTAAEKGETHYSTNDLIDHPRYGRGIVRKAVRSGSEWRITVDFGFDEPKTLVTGYVPIPVIKRKATIHDLD